MHAARDMLGLWLLQSGLVMTMTHLPYMAKKLNAQNLIYTKEKNICIYTQTYNWNISGMIPKKLLAVAVSVKLGRWVVRGEF